MNANVEVCPLCSSELSQTKFREIKAKQRELDERRATELSEAKAAMSQMYEQQLKNRLEHSTREAEKRIRAEAEKDVKKLLSEQEQLKLQLKAAATREAEIRKQAKAEVAREKEAAEKRARADAETELKRVTAERDIAAAKLKQAEARETAIRKEAAENAEKHWRKEISVQREALDKSKSSELLKQQSEFNRERESWQRKIKVLEQQAQKKTANELGDGGEIEIFEALREAFDGNTGRTTRTPKGQNGADILHEVFHKGEPCGRIIIDSKVRQSWKNEFVVKLRQYQVEAGAEHAILATTAFPADRNALCVESGVIVISPALIVYMVQLLRKEMLAAHVKGLSAKQRASKMSRLYDLITSQSYSAKFAEANRLTDDALELEIQEKAAHDNVWRKRGALVKRMQYVLREIETEVSAITESTEGAQQILQLAEDKNVPLGPVS